MITAINLWEADRLRKLKTVAAVDEEIVRCNMGRKAAPNIHKQRDWELKLRFLARLKEHIAMGGGQ